MRKYNRNGRQVIVVQKYGVTNFLIDCVMTFVTGGFWLIWVGVREIRKARI